MRPNPLRVAAACLAALTSAALPPGPAAAAESGGAVSEPTAAAPALVRAADGWSVQWNGRSEALRLPAGVGMGRIAALGAGWIAVGGRKAGDRLEIYLVADSGRGAVELAPPGDPVGLVREGAVPVIAGDRLAGVAWLEGNERRSYAVRWAAWAGSAFGSPVEIAPRGPGSQLALAAAALGDGRIVVVWSGFDGLDDEVWASVGDGARWSPPERVGADNAVPDVTPDVVAAGGGALVAWSRFDGSEYRVRLARLDGDRFVELDAEGPGGSLAPTFAGADPRPRLLFRDARGDDWALAELTDAGRLVTRARAAGSADERPAVTVAGGQARFRFPAGEVVSDWR